MLKIRLANLSNLTQLSLLDKQVNLTPWQITSYHSAIKDNASRVYVLELNSIIVACLVVKIILDELEILQFWVNKVYQRLGYANHLFTKVLAMLRQTNFIRNVYLEVRAGNIAAINLYTKLGFKQVGYRKDYYNQGGILYDASIMHMQAE